MIGSTETVRLEGEGMWVGLSDRLVIGVPLGRFPRLLPAERERFEISPFGIHWEALYEDVSVGGLLAGRGDRQRIG